MPEGTESQTDWVTTIQKELSKNGNDKDPLEVKKLRNKVLKSLDLDVSDKDGKKKFKRAMKTLEEEGILGIDAEGAVTLKKQKKRKKEKKDKKKSKRQKVEAKEDEDSDDKAKDDDEEAEEEAKPTDDSNEIDFKPTDTNSEKGIPCKGNPQGVTRLFLGNLPFTVDEKTLGEFLPKDITHIKWITDKETGKFYGSAFIEMDTPSAAAGAVAKANSQLMGRPIKINFAPARPGDVWPPANKVVSGGDTNKTGGGGQAGGRGIKAMGPKPENCVKLFIGNLSYDIDDDAITKFFDNVGAEVKAVRWLSHKETGDFKGCGFVEFWKAEACDKAATLNGKALLARPIRIDWTD